MQWWFSSIISLYPKVFNLPFLQQYKKATKLTGQVLINLVCFLPVHSHRIVLKEKIVNYYGKRKLDDNIFCQITTHFLSVMLCGSEQLFHIHLTVSPLNKRTTAPAKPSSVTLTTCTGLGLTVTFSSDKLPLNTREKMIERIFKSIYLSNLNVKIF